MQAITCEDMVKLTVLHEDLEKGGAMEQGVSRGWPIVLSSLKSWLETGEAIDIFAKPLDTDNKAA